MLRWFHDDADQVRADPRGRIIVAYAHRNALQPVLTITGIVFSTMLGANVLVEKVFSWPGMGMVTVNAIGARDYPLITAGVLVISVGVALGALLADLAVAAADPRARMQ